jgi:hypothetical protein
MLNAQKMIEERKKALSIPSIGVQKNTNGKDKKPQITTDFEKQAKIAQLQVVYFINIILILINTHFFIFINRLKYRKS